MNGLKYKIKKCISLILPIFLLGSISQEPFFTKQVEAADIGMVGALPGSVTLWEIFETIFAASGIIIANDQLQTAAAGHFGSSTYTLDEMVDMGFIPIGTDGSSALDWDWSGLEDELANASGSDTKIIRDVFSQSGGQGSGGNDEDPDNDPWYKKAVNWVKNAVVNGKIELTNQLSNGAESITYSLTSLAGMIGAAFNNNIRYQYPANYAIPNWVTADTIGFLQSYSTSHIQYRYNIVSTSGSWIGLRCYKPYNPQDPDREGLYIIYLLNIGDTTQNLKVYRTSNGSQSITQNINVARLNWSHSKGNTGCISEVLIPTTNMSFTFPIVELPWTDFDALESDKADIRAEFINDELDVSIKSPDIITPTGNATIPSGNPSWVPTPYIEPGTHLEIIPQPQIDEFTQYVTEEVPDPQQAGEAWIDTVNPYVSSDPTPAPTTRPQPTTKPNITPIPAGDPGGEDNPIFTADPDPMPDIEDGFGTTFDLMDYFPFCIPSDLVAAFKVFEVSDDYRQAPYIDWNMKIDRFGIDEHIVLDFSTFDNAAALFRILIFISFCISLVVLTKTLIWS